MTRPYWDDVGRHLANEAEGLFWLSDPFVRRRVNERVTGSPDRWPTDWLREYLAPRLPLREAVNIGCGTGSLERDLVRKGIVARIVGIDSAPQPVEYARRETEKAGLSAEQAGFVSADARQFLAEQRNLDAVFFHGSLHHFDRLDELMEIVEGALGQSGLLIADEHVGPSMGDWGPRTLLLPNVFYYLLPRRLRRVRVVRTPRNPDDPTEMICSAQIRGAIARRFRVEAARDYGGNLVSLIYPCLRRPGIAKDSPTPEEFRRGVEFLLRSEDRLLRWPGIFRQTSFYSLIVAQKR